MKNWKFKSGIEVYESKFDYDLHCFKVYNGDNYLGAIYPQTIDDMLQVIDNLNNDHDPIDESWEDGCGNTCTLDGWE